MYTYLCVTLIHSYIQQIFIDFYVPGTEDGDTILYKTEKVPAHVELACYGETATNE